MEYHLSIPTSQARDRLAEIIIKVQDPRSFCVLTRHGKPVAGIVSMAELNRIWKQEDMDDLIAGTYRPSSFHFGNRGHLTNAEAAEAIQKVQLDRRMEREVLAKAGLKTIPGGELEVTAREVKAPVPEAPRRKWWRWW